MKLIELIKDREPALTIGFVQALLGCALAFGVPLNSAQVAAIMSLTAMGLSWLLRRFVTPTGSVSSAAPK